MAVRSIEEKASYSRDDERDLTFAGFLTFTDRPKQGVTEAITDLAALGVSIKLITATTCSSLNTWPVRLECATIACSPESSSTKCATKRCGMQLNSTDLFVEVDPNQKERIILSLKKMGHVVGFLGDGVTMRRRCMRLIQAFPSRGGRRRREAADFVLLEQHLDVIRGGIEEGRKTSANTLSMFTTMSANLGTWSAWQSPRCSFHSSRCWRQSILAE